ncbi:tryptophan halogenase family protein [Sphingomonas sp.]|uniref:tryptophan halogenase family protein n=1 Tax=Sphingomonas sp. TaxID=28214 RepID=UPI0025D5E790|nr:tryptophan halogenase family protein [Sphingomonas sp.]
MEGKRSILIVGGGTAGWLTAAYLAKFFDLANRSDLSISLVESPGIGIVGVGEGAFPTIRTTLQFLDIDERDFIRATGATFKQGIRFDHWVRTPAPGEHDHFFHPFEAPLYTPDASLVSLWLAEDETTRPPFAQAVTIQHRVAEERRGPKRAEEDGFAAPLNYAYHFDATALARLLADRARQLGVAHIEDRLLGARLNERGGIGHLDFERSGALTADLYVDCTGLAAELIGNAMREPLVSVRRYLFTDRALACRVPRGDPEAPFPSYTIAAAHEGGWIWDIGLRDLRGVGSVYSSDHIDEARARDVLGGYIGRPELAAGARLIAFEPGYRRRQWVGNCVAVGMAAGFLEPLESTGIVLIEAAAAMIAELLPPSGPVDASADRFNALMAARFDNIVNFLKLHYCLSRRDEPFWRDNADLASIPDALAAMLDRWRSRPPSRFDFTLDVETFAYFNYQYILYGMGFRTEPPSGGAADTHRAANAFARIRHFGDQAVDDLPSHRELIRQINES